MKRKWIALLLAAVLAGCSAAPAQNPDSEQTEDSENSSQTTGTETGSESKSEADQEFEKFTNDYFIHTCERSYLTAHSYFEDYTKEGITLDDDAYELGTFDIDQEELDYEKKTLETLRTYDKSKLDEVNQEIYEQLEWELDLDIRTSKEEFLYLGSVWSESHGLQTDLYNAFSEFSLYTKDDVGGLIRLLENVPGYVEDAIEFSRKQGENGTLAFQSEEVLAYCQDVLDNKANSPVTADLDLEVDTLMLSDAEAKDCKDRIHEALDKYFFPAYQTMIDGLKELEPLNGPIQGLASYKNGKEYYQLILESATSTDKSIADLLDETDDAIDETIEEYSSLNLKDSYYQNTDPIDTGFDSVEKIMSYLDETYATSFPVLEPMDYEVEPLPKEKSQPGVMAYFVVPPINSTRPYEIRYNSQDYGEDPSSLEFFNTLAHEGIPGHMYARQYQKEHFTQNIQYMLGTLAMTEGYATYAAEVAQGWLDVDKTELQADQLNEWFMNYQILQADLLINGQGMTVEEFVSFFGEGTEPLYYQLAEDPGVFFSYYYGYYEITNFREDAIEELGSKFDEVKFNNALLQAGDLKFDIIEQNIADYVADAKAGK